MLDKVKTLMISIPNNKLTHTLREANQAADKLANRVVTKQLQNPTSPSTHSWELTISNDMNAFTFPRFQKKKQKMKKRKKGKLA